MSSSFTTYLPTSPKPQSTPSSSRPFTPSSSGPFTPSSSGPFTPSLRGKSITSLRGKSITSSKPQSTPSSSGPFTPSSSGPFTPLSSGPSTPSLRGKFITSSRGKSISSPKPQSTSSSSGPSTFSSRGKSISSPKPQSTPSSSGPSTFSSSGPSTFSSSGPSTFSSRGKSISSPKPQSTPPSSGSSTPSSSGPSTSSSSEPSTQVSFCDEYERTRWCSDEKCGFSHCIRIKCGNKCQRCKQNALTGCDQRTICPLLENSFKGCNNPNCPFDHCSTESSPDRLILQATELMTLVTILKCIKTHLKNKIDPSAFYKQFHDLTKLDIDRIKFSLSHIRYIFTSISKLNHRFNHARLNVHDRNDIIGEIQRQCNSFKFYVGRELKVS